MFRILPHVTSQRVVFFGALPNAVLGWQGADEGAAEAQLVALRADAARGGGDQGGQWHRTGEAGLSGM